MLGEDELGQMLEVDSDFDVHEPVGVYRVQAKLASI
jgi:hypothetical protein